MCEVCFIHEYSNFPSQTDFEQFESKLDKVDKETFRLMGQASNKYTTYYEYYCKACQETWFLSVPENAWRGYFLKKYKASAYLERLETDDKKRKTGCYILLILLLIALAILIVKLFL